MRGHIQGAKPWARALRFWQRRWCTGGVFLYLRSHEEEGWEIRLEWVDEKTKYFCIFCGGTFACPSSHMLMGVLSFFLSHMHSCSQDHIPAFLLLSYETTPHVMWGYPLFRSFFQTTVWPCSNWVWFTDHV